MIKPTDISFFDTMIKPTDISFFDTNNAPESFSLPLNPKIGDIIIISKLGKNNLTLQCNKKIMGSIGEFKIRMEGTVEFCYTGDNGWVIYNISPSIDPDYMGVQPQEQPQEQYTPAEKFGRKILSED
jgi:hypothetical protein